MIFPTCWPHSTLKSPRIKNGRKPPNQISAAVAEHPEFSGEIHPPPESATEIRRCGYSFFWNRRISDCSRGMVRVVDRLEHWSDPGVKTIRSFPVRSADHRGFDRGDFSCHHCPCQSEPAIENSRSPAGSRFTNQHDCRRRSHQTDPAGGRLVQAFEDSCR